MNEKQFTIGETFKLIALISIALAIVTAFPKTFALIFYYVLVFLPSIAMIVFAFWISVNRIRTGIIMISMIAFCGWLFSTFWVYPGNMSYWQLLWRDASCIGLLMFMILAVNALPEAYLYFVKRGFEHAGRS